MSDENAKPSEMESPSKPEIREDSTDIKSVVDRSTLVSDAGNEENEPIAIDLTQKDQNDGKEDDNESTQLSSVGADSSETTTQPEQEANETIPDNKQFDSVEDTSADPAQATTINGNDTQNLRDYEATIENHDEKFEESFNEQFEKNNAEFSQRRITLRQVSLEKYAEQIEHFVPPPSYSHVINKLNQSSEYHIIAISGKKKSGKRTFAINLADWILKEKLDKNRARTIWFYTDRRVDQTLLNFVYDENIRENSIIIIREIFQQNLLSEQVDRDHIDDYIEILKRKNVYLIFTASEPDEKEQLALNHYLEGKTNGISLEDVFRKYLETFFSQEEAPNEFQVLYNYLEDSNKFKELKQEYDSPGKLRSLFDKLLDDSEWLEGNGEKLEELISKPRVQAARTWFSKLTPLNPRLYVFFVFLFDSLDPQIIDEIYIDAVLYLRDNLGLNSLDQFIDPRQIGRTELHLQIGIHERGLSLEFEEEAYRQTVMGQLDNYYWLLWSLKDFFVENIKSLKDKDNNYYREYSERRIRRDALAIALGRIGIYYPSALKDLLNYLVSQEDTFVVVSATTILQTLAQTGLHDDFIVEVLEKWSKSKDFDRVWATCLTIDRFYRYVDRIQQSTITSEETNTTDTLLDELDKIISYISEHYRDLEYDEERILDHIASNLELASIPESDPNYEDFIFSAIKMAEKFRENQIRLAIISVIEVISLNHLNRVINLLNKWLEPNAPNPHYEHARMALNSLWTSSAKPGIDRILLKRYILPLLKLLPTTLESSQGITYDIFLHKILDVTFQDTMEAGEKNLHKLVYQLLENEPITTAMQAIYDWYRIATTLPKSNNNNETPNREESKKYHKEGNDLWHQTVLNELMILVNNCVRSERIRLCSSMLNSWGHANHLEYAVHRVMQAILTRSHNLNGEITLLPTTNWSGIFIIDGNITARDRGSSESILQFIRNIGGYISVHIHRLGDAQASFSLGSQSKSANGTSIMTLRDLHAKWQRRPDLLMPIIANPFNPYTPDNTVFVVVLNSKSIIDIEDLFQTLETQIVSSKEKKESPLRKRYYEQNKREDSFNSLGWGWDNRLFFANPKGIPQAHRDSVGRIDKNLFHNLLKLIAKKQTSIPVEDLENYLKIYISDLPEAGNFENLMEEWIDLAKKEEATIHFDITLAISTAFLIEVRKNNLTKACDVLIRWLDEHEDNTFAAKMAMAVSRIIFSALLKSSEVQFDKLSEIFKLLTYFNDAINHFSEITPIIQNIIEWGVSQDRVDFLINNKPLSESFSRLKNRELKNLRDWFMRYDTLPVIIELFLSIDKPLDEFLELIEEVYTWIIAKNSQENNQHRKSMPKIYNELKVDDFTNLVQVFQMTLSGKDNEILYWLFSQLSDLNKLTHNGGFPHERVNYRLQIADHIRQIIQNQLRGAIPELEVGHYYGLVFVDTADRDMLDSANKLMKKLDRGHLDNLVLMLHHLGDSAIQQFNFEEKSQSSKKFEFDDRKLPVIGPGLSRYTSVQDQIAFLTIITQREILDYEDWVEMDNSVWPYRTWLLTNNDNWSPIQGNVIDMTFEDSIDDLPNLLIESVIS